jgi:trk system potassium uptake protein TrkA
MNCCVIGLGTFGYHLATALTHHGASVLAIDSDMDAIRSVQDKVAHVLCLRLVDEESLRTAGIENYDVVVVAMGERFEETLLISAIIKQKFKIPMLICRSTSLIHKEILQLIGADYVILPEQEAGMRLADKLSVRYGNFIRVTQDYSLVYIRPQKKWIGKSFEEIELEKKYQISLLGRRLGENVKPLDNDYLIQEHDLFLIAGSNEQLENLIK